MKLKRNFFPIVVAILMGVIHQSCLEQVDLALDDGLEGFVIDAKLIYPNTTHFISITRLNGKSMADCPNEISIKLTDDNGRTITFMDVKTITDDILNSYIPAEIVDSTYNWYTEEYDYEYEAIDKDKAGYRYFVEWYRSGRYYPKEHFVAINEELEIGRVYTLIVTIDGKEYCATEKLLPPIEITGLKYKPVEKWKSLGEGYITMLCPTFSLVNKPENNSKYFLATGEGGFRIFHTENMKDTISELQLREYNYEPTYEDESIPFSNRDCWYTFKDDLQDGLNTTYSFYPISKDNYEYYESIEKQIRTDGGLYSPTGSTPVTNFTGGTIYGQFIVTSESNITTKEASNYNEFHN